MKSFTEYLNEGRGFELGGKKYSSGFGRYTCNGESISKEEYMKASAQYKSGKPVSTTNTSKQSQQKQEIPAYQPTEKSAINTAISDEYYKVINNFIPNKVAKFEKILSSFPKSLNKTPPILMKEVVYRKLKDSIMIATRYNNILQQAKELANKGLKEKEIINKIDDVYLNDGIEKAVNDAFEALMDAISHKNKLEEILK